MSASVCDMIKQSVNQAQGLYHRLVLVVGEAGSGKTTALRGVAHDLSIEVINVNLALSARLVELTQRQRTLQLSNLFSEIVEKTEGVVLLDNTEILFDHGLHQDPLRLLQGVSRNRCVVASWSGAVVGDKVTYAEAGHPEYRSHEVAGALIVDMNASPGTSTQERRQA